MTDTGMIDMLFLRLSSEEMEEVMKKLNYLYELKRGAEGLTTPRQIRFLEGKGFVHVGQWQFETAKNMIDRIAANGWRVPRGIIPQDYEPEKTEVAERPRIKSWPGAT